MTTRRKLSPGHFPFMHSVVQGIDARASWDRYMRIDVAEVEEAVNLPTLAEFAAERGMEDFSQAEQLETFVDAFGAAAGGARRSRRAPLIPRQLDALRWLEQLVAHNAGPAVPARSQDMRRLDLDRELGHGERTGLFTLTACEPHISTSHRSARSAGRDGTCRPQLSARAVIRWSNLNAAPDLQQTFPARTATAVQCHDCDLQRGRPS